MTSVAAADAIVGMLAVFALIALWLGPVRSLAVDWARDHMFKARDRLFDAALAGKIGFDDPRYLVIRKALNANIRYAHTLSSGRLLWHHLFLRDLPVPSYKTKVYEAAAEIDDLSARETAIAALDEVDNALLWMLFAKSPILSIGVILFHLRVRISFNRAGAGSLSRRVNPYTDLALVEAALCSAPA